MPIELWATPIYDEMGTIVYAIAAFLDITERKQAEKLLADYSRTLETQVAERTAELTRANTQLEQEIAERKQAELDLPADRGNTTTGNWRSRPGGGSTAGERHQATPTKPSVGDILPR